MNATRATCHCGTVELRIEMPADGLAGAHRCDCSFCRRRAAATISVPLNCLEVVKGADRLLLYQWNTGTARHYFCSVCGIYTHHRRRSNPHEYGVNIGCIEGINPAELEPIPWADGVNHPSDS
ncbi:GFA family protein [Roseovarius salis]|uniref:GFA family protein n=1 Tax=Roseovarius salis TaxID=3376063 RepID=UPI0037C5A0C2